MRGQLALQTALEHALLVLCSSLSSLPNYVATTKLS